MSIFKLKLNPSLTENWLLARALFEEEVRASFIENSSKLEKIKASIQDEFAAHLLKVHRKRCDTCPTPFKSRGVRAKKDCSTGGLFSTCGCPCTLKKYVSTATQTSNIGIHADDLEDELNKHGSNENISDTSLPFSMVHDGIDNDDAKDDPEEEGILNETIVLQSQLMAAQDDCDVPIKQEEFCQSNTAVESSTQQQMSPGRQEEGFPIIGPDLESYSVSAECSDVPLKQEKCSEDEYTYCRVTIENESTLEESLPGPSEESIAVVNAGECDAISAHDPRTSHLAVQNNEGDHNNVDDDIGHDNNYEDNDRDEHQVDLAIRICGKTVDIFNPVEGSVFRCPSCKKTHSDHSTSLANERTHSRLGTNSDRLCMDCQKRPPVSCDQTELVQSNDSDKPFKCSVCLKTWARKGDLKEHERIHTGEKPFSCPVCGKRFSRSGTMRKHERTHSAIKAIPCPVCGKKFADKAGLAQHLIGHSGKKKFQCPACSKAFLRKAGLTRHHLICSKKPKAPEEDYVESITGEKPFQCVLCKKNFRTKSYCKLHVRTHTGENLHQCTLCSKSYISKSSLEEHMKIHKGGKEKPFHCLVCKKSFYRNSDWKVHMRNHTGEKPYQCSLCNKSFPQKQSLKYHMIIHTGERPFQCVLCKKGFRFKGSLNKHMRSHSGIKAFQCTVCGKSYVKNEDLKIHMRNHTGERPYQCSVCFKGFTAKNALKSHFRVHTK